MAKAISPDTQLSFDNRASVSVLGSEIYDDVEARMLTQAPSEQHYSFASQMAAAVATDPTAFLLTANSAVPVADSIRGFYEELGAELPVIDYIRVPKPTLRPRLLLPTIERMRLRHNLRDASDNVYVVDEFVSRGRTIKRARQLLQSIGIEDIASIQGKWYGQAKRNELDLDRTTSIHAERMRTIGRKAFEMAYA